VYLTVVKAKYATNTNLKLKYIQQCLLHLIKCNLLGLILYLMR